MNISTISQAILKGSLREGAGAVGDWGRARYNEVSANRKSRRLLPPLSRSPSLSEGGFRWFESFGLKKNRKWIYGNSKKLGAKKAEKSLEISAFLVFSRSDLNRPKDLAHHYKIDPYRKFFRNRSVFFSQWIDLSLGDDGSCTWPLSSGVLLHACKRGLCIYW